MSNAYIGHNIAHQEAIRGRIGQLSQPKGGMNKCVHTLHGARHTGNKTMNVSNEYLMNDSAAHTCDATRSKV